MMNDSVREELKDKICTAPKPFKYEVKPSPTNLAPKLSQPMAKSPPNTPIMSKSNSSPIQQQAVPVAVKSNTTEIAAKQTSPTLVEFQHKNSTVPEWRLQLQNAVRKRVEPVTFVESATAVSRLHLPTSGANALKAEYIEESAPVIETNTKLANAMRRIEESRKRYATEEIIETAPKAETAPNKNYPFYIATKNAEVMPKPPEMKTSMNFTATPKLEDLPVIETKDYDTNKLKPLPNAAIISTNLEKVSGNLPEIELEVKNAPLIRISRVKSDEDDILELEENEFVEEADENEDLAPFAMRFNAGLFDLIIGSFTSLVLLAPFMLSGGKWISVAGFLAFLVTCAIVMFIYLTTAVGMFGKTFGMKLFSLETIDIEENDYPTFHQAAVSSSVYLVSLALGGIGFLPALFNPERRTAPDLLSGTIVVKE
jgi:uncharacterized RDD family membrane protein YckC